MMNPVAEFIRSHPGCWRSGCTTCAGRLGRLLDIAKFVEGQPDYVQWMARIRPEEYRGFKENRNFLPLLLNGLTTAQIDEVVRMWGSSGTLDLVLGAQLDDVIPALSCKSAVLWHAIRRRIRTREDVSSLGTPACRILLEAAQYHEPPESARFRLLEDELSDRVRWEQMRVEQRVQQAVLLQQALEGRDRAREARMAELEHVDPVERVEMILAGTIGVEPPFPLHWTVPATDAVRRLSPALIVCALQKGRRAPDGPIRHLYVGLHIRLGEVRREQRRQLLREIGGFPIEEQVRHLLRGASIAYWYPVALQSWIEAHLHELERETVLALRNRIGSLRDRKWRKIALLLDQSAQGFYAHRGIAGHDSVGENTAQTGQHH
jgi:hypothetical protein